jgi:hypothetical protein
MEAHRVMRRRGSHIFQTIGSQMAVRLLASRSSCPLPPGRFLVPISVTSWVNPRAIVRLEGLGKVKNSVTSLRIETHDLQTVAEYTRLVQKCLCYLLNLQKQMLETDPLRSTHNSEICDTRSENWLPGPNLNILGNMRQCYGLNFLASATRKTTWGLWVGWTWTGEPAGLSPSACIPKAARSDRLVVPGSHRIRLSDWLQIRVVEFTAVTDDRTADTVLMHGSQGCHGEHSSVSSWW